jgi:hypothetical protein
MKKLRGMEGAGVVLGIAVAVLTDCQGPTAVV